MNAAAWSSVVGDLAALGDRSVNAAARIHAEATLEDVPRLLELLESGDNFFVREAAAWPLAELAGITVLPQLLRAYQRGFDEGHDNDGFSAALLEIPALFPSDAPIALSSLVASESAPLRSHAQWLLEFCGGRQHEV